MIIKMLNVQAVTASRLMSDVYGLYANALLIESERLWKRKWCAEEESSFAEMFYIDAMFAFMLIR